MSANDFFMPFKIKEELDRTINLAQAFERRDLVAFKQALEEGANPCLPLSEKTVEKGVLARALQSNSSAKPCLPLSEKTVEKGVLARALQSNSSAEFVAACIKYNYNYYNDMSPNVLLNTYLTELKPGLHDFKFLSNFFESDRIPVLGIGNWEFTNLTPINSFAKNITSQNFGDIFKCIKKFIEWGADPNIPDHQGTTPILHIIENREIDDKEKKIIIENLLSLRYPIIDIDSYGPKQENARELLTRKSPNIRLPSTDTSKVNFHILSILLREKQEEHFVQCFQKYDSNRSKVPEHIKQKNYINLLLTAIRKGLNRAVEVILQTDVDANIVQRGNRAVEMACIVGNRPALEMLLKRDNVHLDEFFQKLSATSVATTYTEEAYELGDYIGCFEVILDSSKVNEEQAERMKSTALEFAVVYKNEKAIIKVFEKGANFGIDNRNKCLIPDIDSKLLETLFDKCIKTNGLRDTDDNFFISIDYSKFLTNEFSESKDMMPIRLIAESENLKHLLNHPLITSFMFLKWHQLSLFFYINFIVSFLFCIILILCIFLDLNNASMTAIEVLKILSAVGCFFIFARELIQWILLREQMFATTFVAFTNFVDFMLIIFSTLTILNSNYKNEPQRTFAVITILLASVEIYLLIDSLPYLIVSTHMLMLKEVCGSFFKSFSQYFMFFVTFVLCFHIVFMQTEYSEASGDDKGYFNSTLGSIFKSFVMITGEFDSGDINFSSPISYGIFLLFVGFMAIVLLNLLNGLAVSDTQKIRAQAELNGSIRRTYNLDSLEKTLNFYLKLPVVKKLSLFRKRDSVRNFINENCIIIRPNDGNKILILNESSNDYISLNRINQDTTIPINDEDQRQTLGSSRRWWSPFSNPEYFAMDTEIVQAAISVIEKKRQLQNEERIALVQETRLKNIEENVKMLLTLQQILAQDVKQICNMNK